ncbi:PLP-dependent aminotransferase family protein [Ensifer sp. ENS04]|uniref:aminotransferase-like domain-containing protein n=1 Tax=Ensifer sp. ENS04 TaxID=2769281 RepID=UPI00177AA7AD|nr:PLP-dependent aminotransferase family protein [Ensifer sp. ENS04]MBD9538908.1 PLP-dependent aminotransferase family protein [Ensifer sp. ENS04]
MSTHYQHIADQLAEEIATGKIKTGEQLPPQREFAYRRGIAPSTASRVYAELVRRGLVSGEVGRGTYVRAPSSMSPLAIFEPADSPVDLQLNFSVLPDLLPEVAKVIGGLATEEALNTVLRSSSAFGNSLARETVSRFIARRNWTPAPEQIVFTGNGRQSLATCLAAVAPPGSRVGVEAMTYPFVKAIAARLNLALVQLPMDGEGLTLEGLVDAHRTQPLRAVYMQPLLHNPLGVSMGPERRAQIACFLTDNNVVAIEDAIYSFLADQEEPVAALAPEHTILIDSMSKRIAPGLSLGMIAAPLAWTDRIAAAARSGGWLALGFAMHAGISLIASGAADRIIERKRAEAGARYRLACSTLQDLTIKGDPRAFHVWLELPSPWRADAFAAAAARAGIAVTPASAFSMTPGYAPNAVRLALALPPIDDLARALSTLHRLAMTPDYELVHE